MRITLLLILVCAALLLTLAACDAEDTKFVQDMADEWAREKNINPQNKDGSINIGGAFNAGLSMAGITSNGDEADAAVQAGTVLFTVKEGDQLAGEGLDTRDLKKVDEAILLRPNDYSYHNARGAILLASGDPDGAKKEWETATNLAKESGIPYKEAPIIRDRLRNLELAWTSRAKNGTSAASADLIASEYCSSAKDFNLAAHDATYLDRTGAINLPCPH